MVKEVAAVAIFKDGKMLMGRRRDNNKWTNPGGHLEKGENALQGAVREVKEETGIDVEPSNLQLLKTKVVTKPDGEKLKIYAYKTDLHGRKPSTMLTDPDEEVFRWHWVSPEFFVKKEKGNELHVPMKDNILMEGLGVEKTAFRRGFEKQANGDDMDTSGKAPSIQAVSALLKQNPKPSDEQVHEWSEHGGYNIHKTEAKIYELAGKFVKKAKELIPGGEAEGKPDSAYPKDQLRKGTRVELEHTKSRPVAKEIAKDHLEEHKKPGDPNKKYYNNPLFKDDLEKKAFWQGFKDASKT